VSSKTTDKGMWLLVRRFPAVVSVEVEYIGLLTHLLTDEGLRAVSSLTGLTSLDLSFCLKVTREGVEALRRETASSNLRIHSRTRPNSAVWQRAGAATTERPYSNQWQAAQPSL
jgi:hypothetical protein